MTKRREFPRAVRAEIVLRATDPKTGVVRCEGCGVQTKIWQVDHTIADGLQIDKSKPLTAKDGKLLCSGGPNTCHGLKTTTQDVPAIAEAKRREAKHLGIKGAKTALAGRTPEQKREAKRANAKPPASGMSEIARRFGATT